MSVEARLARQAANAERLAARVREWLVPLRGDERALDSGCGTGAFALALAPLVGEVVGVDGDAERIEAARGLAPANVRFEVGDAGELPFEPGTFEIAGCLRVLHHTTRPELVVAELTRVLRPGGKVLLADQLSPTDPLAGLELDRFEHARDASHTRLLNDGDVRALLEMNDLVVRRVEIVGEERALGPYLDVVGSTGAERERALELAPGGETYRAEVGWYLAQKRAL